MKKFVLFIVLCLGVSALSAQIIYQTTGAGGNYDAAGTWLNGGSGGAPPTGTATCNCKIFINPGAVVTMNTNVALTNTVVVIKGNGRLTMAGNNRNVSFPGTSAIDIKDPAGSITLTSGNTNSRIQVNGQTVWTQSFTFQSATPGTIQGIASTTSATAPTWSNVALPVKLSEFVASKSGKGVSLSWKTTSEVNSSHFEIERSADGKSFSTIGQVSAAGNTGVEQSYSYSDGAPADGANYYRLKIVDIDAKFEYSPIKSVSFAASALNVVVGPNPATSFINVKVSAPGNEPYRLRLINRAGQVVFDQKYNSSGNQVQLNVANYADGTYFVEVSNTSGLRQLSKVMIVRK